MEYEICGQGFSKGGGWEQRLTLLATAISRKLPLKGRISYRISGVCELRPLHGILNDQETRRFGNWIFSHLQVRGERHLLGWVS
jgi:hypothetical protein